ncbi:TetR/AcrR family transcriptional regulator [Bosea sp. (in: a-proteobacteria)]|uniref:TetR/AcrR family transcriptional regulator n=1 Tax=Bosea sp. (in: a-proteobacteria) TaxID=1871050 RepID=UPI0027372B3B|nr:TetR/AcrR family transcriptional regulator [Bosea sp. (in: a-proteobacteria)]MDP3258485.1 TetR/AcrR family transcriptional regulator [Bosea sp. (in: a-proteobacteria)]
MQKSGGQGASVAGDRAQERRRGRPRAFDREAALETATRLFWGKGYAATSVSDLTEAMGIGPPSLYAAFGSKEGLYAEALRHYAERYQGLVWGRFDAAVTAREAVSALLMDSAAALTGACGAGGPKGCMVTLSAVGSEGHADLGEQVRCARAEGLARIEARLTRALAAGELPADTDIYGLARLVVAVQNGMSIQARDGASQEDLEAVARNALRAWPDDARD